MGSAAPSSVSAANGASGGKMRSAAELGDMKSSLHDACQRVTSLIRLTCVVGLTKSSWLGVSAALPCALQQPQQRERLAGAVTAQAAAPPSCATTCQSKLAGSAPSPTCMAGCDGRRCTQKLPVNDMQAWVAKLVSAPACTMTWPQKYTQEYMQTHRRCAQGRRAACRSG